MIRGLHGMFYTSDADASRAFLRDALKLNFTDVGGGWLIFDLPEADVGVHPIDMGGTAGDHDISFYCDDIQGTVAELRARGVQFKTDPQDHGYGWVTHFTIPGGIEVQLYEPKYQKKQHKPAALAAAKRSTAKQKPAPKKPAKKAAAKKPAKKPAAKKSKRR